jgi:HAD superfamily hydrolase (TIGR01509 family)
MPLPLFFDLDGTLVDSESQHWKAWHDTLCSLGLEFTWQDYEAEAIGRSDPDILAAIQEREPARFRAVDKASLLAEKRQRFVSMARQCPIDIDTCAVLRAVKDWQVALVTSSTRLETFALIEAAGLSHCFKAMVCLDDVSRAKPDPEPYLLAKKLLAVAYGVAFEDSASGRASAQAAGLDVIEISGPAEFCSVMRAEFLLF